MSVVTLPSKETLPSRETLHAVGRRGVAAVGFAAGTDGISRLTDLEQRAPLRLLFPYTAAGTPPLACLTNTAGGLVAGDDMAVAVAVGAGAAASVMAQAAEKVYRSEGPEVRVEVGLSVGAGGFLEWLPQETILFDRARLRRRTVVRLEPGARLLAGEMLVFGRLAHGEVVRSGLARDAWEVWRGTDLLWADALHLEGDLRAVLDAPACFGGANACATLVCALPEPEAARDALRALPAVAGVRQGVGVVKGLLLARWLAAEPHALRQSFAATWGMLRGMAGGLPPALPRLWYV